ncbi:histidine triad nucleotide-binding protein [bacterium]|nr:histidine triad nucleotide-binding protein [bacterium]
MSDCIFCKIVNKEIPSNFVYEDDAVIAINDLNPQADTHVLVIPKTHVASLAELEDEELMVKLLKGVKATAKTLGLTDYRTIMNTGAGAGQTVFHLHVHILSGKLTEKLG